MEGRRRRKRETKEREGRKEGDEGSHYMYVCMHIDM
jgi:hypothetical protein